MYNFAFGVNSGHALGKTVKNIVKQISSEITRPRGLVFALKHHMIILDQVSSYNVYRGKIGPTLGVTGFNEIWTAFENGCDQLKNIASRGTIFLM